MTNKKRKKYILSFLNSFFSILGFFLLFKTDGYVKHFIIAAVIVLFFINVSILKK